MFYSVTRWQIVPSWIRWESSWEFKVSSKAQKWPTWLRELLVNKSYFFSTIGGIVCKDGIILGCEKIVMNKMMVSGTDKRIYSVTRNSGSVSLRHLFDFEFLGRKWTCSWWPCSHATEQRRSLAVRADVRYPHSWKDPCRPYLYEVPDEDYLLFIPSLRFFHHLCHSRYDQWTLPSPCWTLRWMPLILWLRIRTWKTNSSQRNRKR